MRKIILLCISSCLLLYTMLPVRAAQTKTILLYSDHLSVIMLITPMNNYEVMISTIPSNTVFPIQCANKRLSTLSSISQVAMKDCMIDTLSSSLSISITNYIYLHGVEIDKDYTTKLAMSDIKSFAQLQDYFSTLGVQIQPSVLWKFPQYMSTDMSLMELYDFYKLYKADDFSIRYSFLHLFSYQNKWYALDSRLYPTS